MKHAYIVENNILLKTALPDSPSPNN